MGRERKNKEVTFVVFGVSVMVVTAMGDLGMYYEHGHWDGGTRGTYSVLLKLYGHIF